MAGRSRREMLLMGLAASAAAALPSGAPAKAGVANAGPADCRPQPPLPGRGGFEGQRKADLGNGSYLNPVLAGDQPDPSILKDGDVYYKVSSSFYYYPGLLIWQSRDLVNWSPTTPALRRPIGSIFAPDLVKHEGRYYVYFPAANLDQLAAPPVANKPRLPIMAIYVVHAESMAGPWSDPIDMNIYEGIDPGHVVGENGKRYLFIDGGKLIPITDDGLARAGKSEKVYAGWTYPEDWVVETFALEGPKLLRHNGWYYLFSAEGGTAGPPTSHMVVVARSRSVRGPWENCPHNPIVRTTSAQEPWWSRGHTTPVLGPAGDWWLVYHGYENGFRTLGRQMLMEPFDWTADGWPKAKGGDLSQPLAKPRGGKAGPHGFAISDNFTNDRLGVGMAFYKPEENYRQRLRVGSGEMILGAQGEKPGESSPLVINVGDRSYDLSIELELVDGAQGGILLFYDEHYYCGVGSDGTRLHSYKMGAEPLFATPRALVMKSLFLRLVNRDNVATFFYRSNRTDWKTHVSLEVSGYNHNIADGFLSLRPALYATGQGSVRFRSLSYSAKA